MATTPKVFMFWGDSRMVGTWGDAQNMSLRAKILMEFPEYIAVGSVHDLIIGPQTTSAAIPNMWVGESRSYHAATNGYGISNVTSVVAARIAGAAFTPTCHVIMCGVNDINAGTSAAAMMTAAGGCLDAMHAATPSARCVWLGEPNEIFGGGASEAVRSTFNSGMPGTVISPRSAWANWIAMPTDLTAGQFGDIQGIHPNGWGAHRLAHAAITGMKAIPI